MGAASARGAVPQVQVNKMDAVWHIFCGSGADDQTSLQAKATPIASAFFTKLIIPAVSVEASSGYLTRGSAAQHGR